MKKMLSTLAAVGAVFAANTAARAEDFAAWPRRSTILFSGYANPEPLTNFPALVKLGADATREMKANGADLWFASTDGAPLAYEIEEWDTNGVSVVWVRVPELTPGALILAYWGHDPAQPDSTDVWDEYAGVWHFNEPGSVYGVRHDPNDANTWEPDADYLAHPNIRNSTTNQLDGVRHFTSRGPGVTGATHSQFLSCWGNGWDSSSGWGFVRVPHDDSLNLGNRFTVSGWFRYPDTDVWGTWYTPTTEWTHLFGKKAAYNDGNGWESEKYGNTHNSIGMRGDGDGMTYLNMPNGWTFENREWHHVTLQFLGPNACEIFVNGVSAGTGTMGYTTAVDNGVDLHIGSSASGELNWQGYIDEVRIEPAIRSVAWVTACHDTMANPAFAVCGEPEANTGPVLSLGVGNITPVSVDAALTDYSGTGADFWLYWGEADGTNNPSAWDGSMQLFPAGNGVYTNTPAGLTPGTPYFLRYTMDDGANPVAWAASPVEFSTLDYPVPVIGAVTFKSCPDTGNPGFAMTDVTVNIAETGFNPVLVLVWDEGDKGGEPSSWGNALTNDTSVTTGNGNTFQIPGLKLGDTRDWRVFLSADGNVSDEKSGAFTVLYVYTWVGPADGAAYWKEPGNWDIGIVPNHPGAIVVFPQNYLPHVDIAELPESPTAIGDITLGAFYKYGTDYYCWQGELWHQLYSSDGTRLIWDNLGEPIRIEWHKQDYWPAFYIAAPQVFNGKTHVLMTQLQGGNATPLYFYHPSLSGVGPVTLDSGRLSFGAGGGETNLITVPIVFETQGGDWNVNTFNGGGTVIIQGTTNVISRGPQYYGAGMIQDGTRVVLAGGAAVYTEGYTIDPGLFYGWGNSLTVSGGSHFRAVQNERNTYFAGSGSTLLATGPGSTIAFMGIMNGNYNTLAARDGGRVDVAGNFYWDWGVWPYGFNGPLDTWDGPGQTILAASDLPGQPGVIDLTGCGINFGSPGGVIALQPGGVITNTAVVAVYGADSRVNLQGGELFCDQLAIYSGAALAPLVGAGGVKPILATTSAWFEEGAKIIPAQQDPAKPVFGKFPLVTAPEIITPPLEELLDAPQKHAWKLRLETNPDTTQTLSLSCSIPSTLFLLR